MNVLSRFAPCGVLLLTLCLTGGLVSGQPAKKDFLHIGASGGMTGDTAGENEKASFEQLKSFMKSETGLSSEIHLFKDWREVTEKLAKGAVQIGVYQGYEYAWAKELQADLKPLTLAINILPYQAVYIVAPADTKAKDFAGLAGQSFAMPANTQHFAKLFVERNLQGKKLEDFFSKVTTPANLGDTLDDVVDGMIQSTVVDQAALDQFKASKPGRFAKLKTVAQSPPFPPAVIAYLDKKVDEATLDRLRKGLQEADKKPAGNQLLTYFKLSGFAAPDANFDKVLAETRKTYPAVEGKK